jgi:protein CWC15
MTTAHRPTWKPAVAVVRNHGFVSQQTSAKDQIGMTQLKFRQIGQSTQSEMNERNILDELEQREYEQLSEKNKAILQIENEEKKVDSLALLKNHAEVIAPVSGSKFDDEDADYDDRDHEFDSSSSEEDDDEEEEEDDEAELQRELEKIKAERAVALAKKEEEERFLEEALNKESALRGNPLLNLSQGTNNEKVSPRTRSVLSLSVSLLMIISQVKRKWNDDVVFRNQSRSEPEQKKRFINDTIRSDFHKSFLKKYIK